MEQSIYVGIGASAGGLEALQKLVSLLPTDLGYIYIIAQHLTPDKKSLLSHILSRHTTLLVSELDAHCKFLPNHIYILPPQCNLQRKGHQLVLEETKSSPHHPTPSVDILFETLALTKKEKTVAILLSGSGHDGTHGMKLIKEYGGITIAQSPEEALYKSMPKSAIDAGVVNHVLPLTQIAQHLSSLVFEPILTQNIPAKDSLKIIQKILCDQEHLDLRKYKDETIVRRITKRMTLLHLSSLEAYSQYLAEHHQEAHLLYQEVLIGVTSFFRDKEAFNALESALTTHLEKKSDYHELRLWCVACSTGEEAYSLAILVAEVCKRLKKTLDIRIFATDIDDDALAVARNGEYSKESLVDLDPALLEEYFTSIENGYKAKQSLRQKIIFTHHNLLSDPPFINQDIISCRNLLIYLLPIAQIEIFALFHHALQERGILFLGSSESTLLGINYFTPLNSQYKIYEQQYLQNPPKISNHYFSKHLDQRYEKGSIQITARETTNIEEQIANTIFDFFAPHCIIVDQNFTMIYKKGELPYIRFSDGFPTLNLLNNLDESLRYDVKTVLTYALSSKQPQSTKFIEIASPHSDENFVRAIAYPIEDFNNVPMILLYFQELSSDDLQFNSGTLNIPDESVMLKNIAAQLASAREENRILSDELLLTKETMQTMTEELQSSNEELQSSNEELETSNEELQSSNEELHASLSHIEKLQQQLSLILNSSFDGILGLDINARHTFANTAAASMLGYTPEELVGKDSHSLWHHTKMDGTSYPKEECPILNVLRLGKRSQEQDLFWRKDGTSLEVESVRSPIIEGGEVTGAVVSFRDITEKNRLERIATHEHQLIDLYMSVADMIIMTLDTNANITMINDEGCSILGVPHAQIIGTNWIDTFILPEQREEVKAIFLSIITGETLVVSHYANTIIDAEGKNHFLVWTNTALKDIKGNITGTINSGIDATEMKVKDDIMISQSRQAAMGDMLAMIAHQWRQPLSVVSMATNTLKAHLELEEEITKTTLEQLIKTINEQTRYLSHTIDDFRDFFKPDKVKERTSIAIILEKLVSLIQKGLENNGIALELPKNQSFTILTYPNQLLQALINIINNAKDAIKEHNPIGGIIRITLTQEEGEIILQICDNGGGIDPAIKDKLSQPYVTTKATNGTGLGLYMSTIIVSKHLDGRLWWTSDAQGSCFFIALPSIIL